MYAMLDTVCRTFQEAAMVIVAARSYYGLCANRELRTREYRVYTNIKRPVRLSASPQVI